MVIADLNHAVAVPFLDSSDRRNNVMKDGMVYQL